MSLYELQEWPCITGQDMKMKKKGDERAQARKQGHETTQQRVERLYDSDGGPLLAWLIDEARCRGMSMNELAAELGVTYGYINQLRSGIRQVSCIGQDFADLSARFLGVPAIVVKLLAGRIRMSDFAWPQEGEEMLVERAYRQLKADRTASQHLPANDAVLSLEAKRALVMLYGETSGVDVLGLRKLSWILEYLQRPALIHNENEVESLLRKGELSPSPELYD